MTYDLYDILTINDIKYIIIATYFDDKTQYFLLVELNDYEEIMPKNIKVVKQSVYNNLDTDILRPVKDIEELHKVKKILDGMMKENLKDA